MMDLGFCLLLITGSDVGKGRFVMRTVIVSVGMTSIKVSKKGGEGERDGPLLPVKFYGVFEKVCGSSKGFVCVLCLVRTVPKSNTSGGGGRVCTAAVPARIIHKLNVSQLLIQHHSHGPLVLNWKRM